MRLRAWLRSTSGPCHHAGQFYSGRESARLDRLADCSHAHSGGLFFELFVKAGGLISYGPDNADLVRRAAVYVDRILKGEKPEDLPVQLPTKFELAINTKAAAALGVKFPPSIIATADDVIE